MKCAGSKAGYLLASVTSLTCFATQFFGNRFGTLPISQSARSPSNCRLPYYWRSSSTPSSSKGRISYDSPFFAPVLVAGVFVAIIFNLVYDQRAGLINQEFVLFGKEIGWLNEEKYVMPAVILTGVWQWAGFNMIYFLAGLQGIRQELYEAAAVDGANWWQAFIHVTLPSLRPVIAFVFVVSMIGSLQLFDLPFILTNGGEPADAGSTIVMYLYKNGFQFMRLGYAATIGWVLFFIIAVISIVQLKLLGIFRDE